MIFRMRLVIPAATRKATLAPPLQSFVARGRREQFATRAVILRKCRLSQTELEIKGFEIVRKLRKQNDDSTAFCTSCGKQIASTTLGEPWGQQTAVQVPEKSILLTTEQGAGAHKYVASDFFPQRFNRQTTSREKQSLMRKNYTLVDEYEFVTGYLNEAETDASHLSLSVEDRNHPLESVVNVSTAPPECSIENPNGSIIGIVAYAESAFRFSVVKPNGMKIFVALIEGGTRLVQFVNAVAQGRIRLCFLIPLFL
jgi:hypothetical protein